MAGNVYELGIRLRRTHNTMALMLLVQFSVQFCYTSSYISDTSNRLRCVRGISDNRVSVLHRAA